MMNEIQCIIHHFPLNFAPAALRAVVNAPNRRTAAP